MNAYTVVICTHDRVDLLRETLDSLARALPPRDTEVDILVVANACSDGTADFLAQRAREGNGGLPLRWVAEPAPGKSHALNRAIRELHTSAAAFIDDDQTVEKHFLRAIAEGLIRYPAQDIFCGRIYPAWDGSEPTWVHERGEFGIFPSPMPYYNLGVATRALDEQGPLPSGGNIVVRRRVFDLVSGFSTELGPRGHDLQGGEDSDFLLKARAAGVTLRYLPDMVQYHYVDQSRLQLGYLIRKSFLRSRSAALVRSGGIEGVPKYILRKFAVYLWRLVTSLYWPQTRYYLLRIAANLGELSAFRRLARNNKK